MRSSSFRCLDGAQPEVTQVAERHDAGRAEQVVGAPLVGAATDGVGHHVDADGGQATDGDDGVQRGGVREHFQDEDGDAEHSAQNHVDDSAILAVFFGVRGLGGGVHKGLRSLRGFPFLWRWTLRASCMYA